MEPFDIIWKAEAQIKRADADDDDDDDADAADDDDDDTTLHFWPFFSLHSMLEFLLPPFIKIVLWP